MGRGPSYPYVDLEQAIGLAKKLYDYARRAPAPVASVITEAWKYKPTSSSGIKVLAALKAFGLVEEVSSNNGKALKLTPRAVRILLDDPGSPERDLALQAAALSPRWYDYCWKTWGKEMPPSMRSNLLIDHHFVQTTVEAFLRDYKKSIAFAGLLSEDEAKSEFESSDESTKKFSIGDYVQWESQGAWQFKSPMRIRAFSEDGEYAFVEGESTGVPVHELIPQAAPPLGEAISPPPPQPKPLGFAPAAPTGANMRQDVFSLAEGTITIQWPASLSQESFQDFSDWLELLKRRIQRSVGPKTDAASAGE
jgi:hypothetical protein